MSPPVYTSLYILIQDCAAMYVISYLTPGNTTSQLGCKGFFCKSQESTWEVKGNQEGGETLGMLYQHVATRHSIY